MTGTEHSPVVPSVGAVPVEVPVISRALWPVLRSSITGGDSIERIAERVTAEVSPLIAARVRAEGEKQMAEAERILEQAIRERDEAEEWADRLAAALAGDTAGEHSSANNPWQNALDIAAEREDRVRAEERRRAASELQQFFKDYRGVDWGDVVELSRRIMAGSAVPVATPDRPEIVVLCGSTRFKDAFREAAKSEALAGRIVLTVSDLDPRPEMRHVNVPIDAETRARLDQLHRHKIDLADRVLVLNVGGYIGESTRAEIEYATAHGKPITYLEAASAPCEHNCPVAHVDSDFITGAEVRCPGPVATPTEPVRDLCAELQASVDRARGVVPAEQDGQR